MPGIRLAATVRDVGQGEFAWRLAQASRRDDDIRSVVFDDGQMTAVMTRSDAYLARIITIDSTVVVIEGEVYNKSDADLAGALEPIVRAAGNRALQSELITSFVRSSDGDFVISMIDAQSRQITVFNDSQARLAVYYYISDDLVIIGRDPKPIVELAPKLHLDRHAIVDTLALSYPLGSATTFREMRRLEPNEALQIDVRTDYIVARVHTGPQDAFILERPFTSEEESLDALHDLFMDSLRIRAEKIQSRGWPIVVDLSGGFDTRAVFGGVVSAGFNADCYTFDLATGDEREAAERLFHAMGDPGTLTAISARHEYDTMQVRPLVMENDGLVNHFTSAVCDSDVSAYRDSVGSPAGRFGGLGGEFIRHPYRNLGKSLWQDYSRGVYSCPPALICSVVRLSSSEYKSRTTTYLSSYPERDGTGLLRRWYYEYYNHYVSAAAEDRERTKLWTVHPMWGARFTDAIFKHIPLSWVGYRYFTRFLERIDGRLAEPPIFRKAIDLRSESSLRQFDKRDERRSLRKHRLKSASPVRLQAAVRGAIGLAKKEAVQACRDELELANASDEFASAILDLGSARRLMGLYPDISIARRISTLSMYIDGLYAKYGSKILEG